MFNFSAHFFATFWLQILLIFYLAMDNKESVGVGCNGTIYHEGFKFHHKYVSKKVATYWCCHNWEKTSDCQIKIKIKIDKNGKVVSSQGQHHVSCYYKQQDTRKALGYLNPSEPEDKDFENPPDMTAFMLKRAEEIALEDISMPPKKFTSRSFKKFNLNIKFSREHLIKK